MNNKKKLGAITLSIIMAFGFVYLITINSNGSEAVNIPLSIERSNDLISKARDQDLLKPKTFITSHFMDRVQTHKIKLDISNSFKIQKALYVDHNPISIDGNSNFIDTADDEGWAGAGTEQAPYVIEGFRIDGPSNTPLIEIKNTNVYFNISNCLLTNGESGIIFDIVTHGSINHNVILNFSKYGIRLKDSYEIIITDNNISQFQAEPTSLIFGIMLGNSNQCIIANNTINDGDGEGIYFWSSNGISILNNTIFDIWGMAIFCKESNFGTISNNTIHSNWAGIIIGSGFGSDVSNQILIFNNTIRNIWSSGISTSYSDSSTISNNTIYDIGDNPGGTSSKGIRIRGSSHTSVIYNTVYNVSGGVGIDCQGYDNIVRENHVHNTSSYGIRVSNAEGTTISDNIINDTSVGIELGYYSEVDVFDNRIFDCRGAGIIIWNADNNNVYRNSIYNLQLDYWNNPSDGILITSGENNNIYRNLIFDNLGYGIRIENAHRNVISCNEITNNAEYGISLSYTEFNELPSTENIINNNNFIQNNPMGTSQGFDDNELGCPSKNLFRGNYWDDWSDSGGYDIDGPANNIDPSAMSSPNPIDESCDYQPSFECTTPFILLEPALLSLFLPIAAILIAISARMICVKYPQICGKPPFPSLPPYPPLPLYNYVVIGLGSLAMLISTLWINIYTPDDISSLSMGAAIYGGGIVGSFLGVIQLIPIFSRFLQKIHLSSP